MLTDGELPPQACSESHQWRQQGYWRALAAQYAEVLSRSRCQAPVSQFPAAAAVSLYWLPQHLQHCPSTQRRSPCKVPQSSMLVPIAYEDFSTSASCSECIAGITGAQFKLNMPIFCGAEEDA